MSAVPAPHVSRAPIGLLAFASALAAANIYYNQPLLADIAREFHAEPHSAGWVSTATQIGYALGMPAFIPLGDIVDRRNLVVGLFLIVALALVSAGSAPSLALLVVSSFCIGFTTIIAQILIPLASDLSPADRGGKTVGTMLSGVLLGILLARTVSGFVAHHLGWRAMFYLAAGMALLLAVVLRSTLPSMPPKPGVRYVSVMASIWEMFATSAKLRQVCTVAACFMASFSAFWTTLTFFLEQPPYHYGSQAAGLFGLVGAIGAGVAPLAGHWSDRKNPRFVVAIAIAAVTSSFCIFAVSGTFLTGLVLGVILLDAGTQGAQVANQSRILRLRPDAKNRINTVYMIVYFTGGSFGSFAGSLLWGTWGWAGVCATGLVCMLCATVTLLSLGPVNQPSMSH